MRVCMCVSAEGVITRKLLKIPPGKSLKQQNSVQLTHSGQTCEIF